MPRPGPRRAATALRLGDDILMQLDERALLEEFVKGDGEPNRSDMIRLFVDYGLATMPMNWRPTVDTLQKLR
ncbi:hypothetical protein [Rhodococcus sp. 24CO]|uniref:hypothetical protein n=1 Tax=Rhodococcus sp. 24CO TaxID=3117460 RepID=UPI003D32555F